MQNPLTWTPTDTTPTHTNQQDKISDTKIYISYSQKSSTTQASLSCLFIKIKQSYLAKLLAQQKVQQLNQALHETKHTELCVWTLLHSSDIYSSISSSPTQNPQKKEKKNPVLFVVLSPPLAILWTSSPQTTLLPQNLLANLSSNVLLLHQTSHSSALASSTSLRPPSSLTTHQCSAAHLHHSCRHSPAIPSHITRQQSFHASHAQPSLTFFQK
jgi:hypothetical protein